MRKCTTHITVIIKDLYLLLLYPQYLALLCNSEHIQKMIHQSTDTDCEQVNS